MEELEFFKTKAAFLEQEVNQLRAALLDAQIKSGDIRLESEDQ